MKKFLKSIILIFLGLASLCSCGSAGNASSVDDNIARALSARNFNIVLTQTIPRAHQHVYYPTGTYIIRVRGNNATMSLPKLTTAAGSTFETGYVEEMDLKEEPRYNKGTYLFRLGPLPNKNYILELRVSETGSARITGGGIAAPFYGKVELPNNE